MSTFRRLSLVLVVSLGVASEARAGEPLTVSPAEEEALYVQARQTALPAKEQSSAGGGSEKFAREGCFSDPSKCKCQSTDAAKSQFCGTILGHFCPDSTLRYLAAACMDLFGGATLCQCAAKQQIESFIAAEDAAKAKAEKEAAKKGKKGKKKATTTVTK